MSIVGSLKFIGNNEYVGSIKTLKLSLDFYFVSKEKASPNAPAYDVVIKQGRSPIIIGAAWQKLIMRGAKSGKHFFTISVDDHSFDKPLFLSAFPTVDNNYDIVWNRQKEATLSIAPISNPPESKDKN